MSQTRKHEQVEHIESLSRRRLLRLLAGTAAVIPFSPLAWGQGWCRDGYKTEACPLDAKAATQPIKPLFAPTDWRTVALDRLTFRVADYRKEAAFYAALLGWNEESDDGTQAVLTIGDWASVVFRQASPETLESTATASDNTPTRAVVESMSFVVAPWNAKEVEAQLRTRGVSAVPENDGDGFESYRMKDPDGFEIQISNRKRLAKGRPVTSPLGTLPSPFEPTGWKTVWLDHVSFQVTNYKESASFYCNLLGWTPTYDEGSQIECKIGDVGDIIIRGGNPFDPGFGKSSQTRHAKVDHISFGIEPWDTDRVKAGLEKRGLTAKIDTAKSGEIHVSAYKSYHTTTPNGYNLQISPITRESRLTLSEAVKPQGADRKR